MKIVGLTGGIGSGKSYIANLFRCLGISVYDSDSRAKELCNFDASIRKNITDVFGEESYKDGLYNRKYIASIVFNNKELLNKLNSIVHPVLEKDFDNWCLERVSKDFVVKESAILFETGMHKNMDCIILVTAPEDIKVKRIMERDNLNYEQIMDRMKNQWNDGDREKLSDFVIVNDGRKNIDLLNLVIDISDNIRNGN